MASPDLHLVSSSSGMPAAQLAILAVDDDRSLLFRLEAQLKQFGYEVATARDGESAMALLNAHPQRFGVVLLDREMPGMNGLAVVRAMKDDPALSRIPIVMQTGSDSPDQIREGIDAGVFYYLTKPYETSILASVIAAALREAEQQRTWRADLKRHRAAFGLIETALFTFRTLAEAEDLASFAANCFPDPERTVGGLSELLVNAVEHGNLGITYEEKTVLVETGKWTDEVERRLALPAFASLSGELLLKKKEDGLYVQITDQGEGFDWQRYLKIDPSRASHNHGRGIAQAHMLAFDQLSYHAPGNRVVAMVKTGSGTEAFSW